MLEWSDRDFKAAIIKMLQWATTTCLKQMGNKKKDLSKEIEGKKKNQMGNVNSTKARVKWSEWR